jgi:hypothetical protein
MTEKRKAPGFMFYPDKWTSHTKHLSDAAYAVYHKMICWMWDHSDDQFSMTQDPALISLLLSYPESQISAALSEIRNPVMCLLKVRKADNCLISDGLRKEAEKQEARRQRGCAAANKRWMPTQCQPNANPMPRARDMDIDIETVNKGGVGGTKWIMELWNEKAPAVLPRVGRWTEKRAKTAKQRLADYPDRADWERAIVAMADCPFLLGENDRQWLANIDFFLRPDTITRILEGEFRGKSRQRGPGKEAP